MNIHLEVSSALAQVTAPEADSATFYSQWLALLVNGIEGVGEAVLVIGDANVGPFGPAAFWPAGQPCGDDVALLCEQCLGTRLPLSQSGARGLLAVPVLHESDIFGVVVLAFSGQAVPPQAAERIRREMGWLLLHCRRHDGEAAQQLRERLLASLDLMMSALGEDNVESACQAVVTDASVRLGCDRVAVGFCEGKAIRLAAISNVANFARRIDLTHALEAAMNEAADHGASLYLAPGRAPEEGAPVYHVVREHEALVRDYGNGCVLSVPFLIAADRYGVFLFEWHADNIGVATRQLAESLAPILGRVLLDKRSNARPLLRRVREGIKAEIKRLFGPYHAGRKLAAAAVVLTVLFFSVAFGDYRISAHSSLEGSVRRVIVAPFDGFVATATARAGHVVKADDELATLDDRDIRLESSRWGSQQDQYAKQAQDAEAQHNLAQLQISLAQTRQAGAQLALSETMLERARVRAPFTGVIVSGDLSQHLGGAVKKGQTLFEIAPLDSYRVVLEVDEADIADVAVGQRGELVVTALSNRKFPFIVTLVTPVARVNEGKNFFRVEANLEERTAQLRPGMDGVGKIISGQRRLIWIWTHGMFDWLRLQLWNWMGI